ncbi:MAG: J domain-containing protein [Synergistaceae bacterium]|jgi:hypothetical protein|nr:J domain-containing protein [Synergistaceae bacterium]
MDEFYDHCYAVLGLSPGAAPEEVRSAYRRLLKRYHPDHDKSIDAQIKYAEVRAAYDSLHSTNDKPVIELVRPQQPPSSHRDTYRGHTFDAGSYRRKAPPRPTTGRKTSKKRRTFSWAALPLVLWESVDEIAGLQMLARSALTCYILWSAIAPTTKALALLAMPLSLCGSAVFRYYCTRTPRDKGVYFLASLCYGVGLSAVFTVWTFFLELTWHFLLTKFVYHSLVFYMAILALWVRLP